MVAVDHICVFSPARSAARRYPEALHLQPANAAKLLHAMAGFLVFCIVQTNLVNAQGESWTGEMDDRNNLAETHRKNAGVSCFTTPRHLFTDNRSSGFCTAFRTVCSVSG